MDSIGFVSNPSLTTQHVPTLSFYSLTRVRMISSVGRALGQQSEGSQFESGSGLALFSIGLIITVWQEYLTYFGGLSLSPGPLMPCDGNWVDS